MYVRHDISQRSLDIQSPLQAVAVQVDLGRRKYTICSLYIPPNDNVTYDNFKDLLQQLPQPFLILGDTNSRHPLWGDVVANVKGNLIASLLENEDIGLLNTGEPTHFHVQTGTLSCIDLSITSSNCLIDFNWKTLDDWHTSDHAPIIISTDFDPQPFRSPGWVLNKADWKKFQELSDIEGDADDFHTVDDAIDLLNGTFHTAGVHSIPRSTGLFRRRPVPWWSLELQVLHRLTRRSLTRLRRHRTEENLIFYKKCRAQFRRAVKAAKRESWISYVASINERTPPSSVWRKVRKIAGKFIPHPPPVLKENGELITGNADVSNILAKHFANISSKSETSPGYQYRSREELKLLDFTTNRMESYNEPFTEREFDSALKSCNDTAPALMRYHMLWLSIPL